MVKDCSWLRKWKRPRVATFEIHGIVTSFPDWIKDAKIMFSSYNIDLVSSNHIISGVQELNDPAFFKVYLSMFYIIPYTTNIQSNHENPHVDYPDFSIIQTFLKTPIIWTISSSLDESGAQVSITRMKPNEDCSWLRKWKRPRVATFEIHGNVTSLPSWIKDAMVVFSSYNIDLVSSNQIK